MRDFFLLASKPAMSRMPMKLTFFIVGSCRKVMKTLQDEDITHNEGSIAEIDKPEEKAIVGGPRQGGHSVETLVRILAFVHPLSSNLCMPFKN